MSRDRDFLDPPLWNGSTMLTRGDLMSDAISCIERADETRDLEGSAKEVVENLLNHLMCPSAPMIAAGNAEAARSDSTPTSIFRAMIWALREWK